MDKKKEFCVEFTGGTKTPDGLKIHTDILNKMFIRHFGDVKIESRPFIDKNLMYRFMLKFEKEYKQDPSILTKIRGLMEDIIERLCDLDEGDTIPMLKEGDSDQYYLTSEFKVHVEFLLKMYDIVVKML